MEDQFQISMPDPTVEVTETREFQPFNNSNNTNRNSTTSNNNTNRNSNEKKGNNI